MNNFYFIFILPAFVIGCTFGSIGDSLDEKKKIISGASLLISSLKSSIRLNLYSYDDRGDDDISSFRLTSGTSSDVYRLDIRSGTLLSMEQIEVQITTGNVPSGSLQEGMADNVSMHVTDSGGTDNASGVSNFIYSTANNLIIRDFYIKNGADDSGPFNLNVLNISGVSQGNFLKARMHTKSLVFMGTITYLNNSSSKDFTLQIGEADLTANSKCKKNVSAFSPLTLNVAFKYSNILKDTGNNLSQQILKSIFLIGGSPLTFSPTQNTAIYNEILKNISLADTFQEVGCTP
ncbi:MAG: hypothetical protein K8R21_06275 [Leptospira sp.]|nr:hypothetical protein [Leptospira sp.]